MRHILTFFWFLCTTTLMFSQDTTWVNTLRYSSKTRDTTIRFPEGDHNQYEKILMYYSMRCKGALVSTGTDRNKGCGEWDYSCNTNIIDSTRTDSTKATHPNYIISGYNQNFLFYTVNPTFTYTDYGLKQVTVQDASGTARVMAGQHSGSRTIINRDKPTGRFWVYYTADELSALGSGNISGINLKHTGSGKISWLKVRIASTTTAPVGWGDLDNLTFKEVVNRHVTFGSSGQTDIFFHTPFSHPGDRGLVVEFSFQGNETQISSLEIKGSQAVTLQCYGTQQTDRYLVSGSSGAGQLTHTGLTDITNEVTVTFWARGNEAVLPNNNSVFHATDAQGRRQLNVHLPWSNGRIYWDCGGDAAGYDRIDKAALPADYEGSWNHWAFTKNTVTGSMKIYLNGSVWHSGTGKTKPIDISNFSLGAVQDGTNAWFGDMDDFTVWQKELTPAEIATIMHDSPSGLPAQAENLVVFLDMNESENDTLADLSAYQGTMSFAGRVNLQPHRPSSYFTGMNALGERPDLSFIKGNAIVSVTEVIQRDSVMNVPLRITPYSIEDNRVVAGNPMYYWEAVPQKVYDESGNITGEIEVEYDDVIDIIDLSYFRFSPAKYEIMSFVTPYGIGLDLGAEGKTWTFDVTDYGPILKGQKRLLMDKGGEYQEEMDIKFAFVKGRPVRDVLDIQQIWPATSYGYTSILNNSQLEARTLQAETAVKSMKIRTMATGHGQEGEFISRVHSLNINGGTTEFSWPLWKECADNPIYPQGGTWVYDRAGWCPGAPTDLREFEIMPLVQPGSSFTIDYGLNTATGDSRYIVNTQLVKYGEMNFANDVAIEEIISPSTRVEYSRRNPVCADPVIVVRNTGKNTVSSVIISYQVDDETPRMYTWTGNLSPLQRLTMTLPGLEPALLYSGKKFSAEIVSINNIPDQNQQNNHLSSAIVPVKALGKDIVVTMKTNGAPNETKWTLQDSNGNIIRSSKPNLSAFTIYNDTITGLSGCYQLRFTDSDQDGISWWANGDGDGYMRVKPVNGPWVFFQPDFGSELTFNFVAALPSGTEESAFTPTVKINPNPTSGLTEVSVAGLQGDMVLLVSDPSGKTITRENLRLNGNEMRTMVDLGDLPPGLYCLRIIQADKVSAHKIIRL